MRPVRRIAMSWHPPHHFEGFVPIVSCMYSIDLRYHWLLKEEKWWADDSHCAVMSGWHPLLQQDFASRKRSDRMSAPDAVLFDDGKKGLFSPPPSSCGPRGGSGGFTIAETEAGGTGGA